MLPNYLLGHSFLTLLSEKTNNVNLKLSTFLIYWKQPIVCHRLEECYFLQNIYLGVEVADDAVAAVYINTEFPWVVKSLSILSC